jgi:hypothetical protein
VEREKFNFDRTALLALFATPVAYGAAFMYESGYMAYFGVPFSLTEATLGGLFRSLLGLMAVSMFVLFLYVVITRAVEASLKVKVPLLFSITIALARFSQLLLQYSTSVGFIGRLLAH